MTIRKRVTTLNSKIINQPYTGSVWHVLCIYYPKGSWLEHCDSLKSMRGYRFKTVKFYKL